MPRVDTEGFPIGDALRLERTAARVTLTDIAPIVGVSVGHLSHIEAGRREASDELVTRIRAAVVQVVEDRRVVA